MNRILLSAVSAIGFVVSARATRNIRITSARARQGDRTAQAHFTQTCYARVFGPRNSDLGIVFYAAVLAAASTGSLRRAWIRRSLLAASVASLFTSVYLLAALRRLRVWCSICLQGHAVNLLTFLLLRRASRHA